MGGTFVLSVIVELSLLVLMVKFRTRINASMEEWFNRNRFFIIGFLVLTMLFVTLNIFFFFPHLYPEAAEIIHKIFDEVLGFIP